LKNIEMGDGMYGVKSIVFDWGDTLMRDFKEFNGPMHLWPEVAAMPGALGALQVVGKGRVIAVATNAIDSREDEIWTALRRASLDSLINYVYCFRKIGFLKPSREFFKYILNNLNLQPSELIMVGDDFEKDILGANRCDIFGIWLNFNSRERRTGKMYDTIHSLSELPSFIESREAALSKAINNNIIE
jgi:FMN phosphatase YigB (HAD superfamily)